IIHITHLFFQNRIIPPSFTRKLKETPCVLGSSALLECKVSGSPPISVAWFRNGLKLVNGEKHQISFSDNLCILEVNSLRPYTCVAANVAGSDECSAFLTVQGQWKDTTAPSIKFFLPLLFLPSGFPWFLFHVFFCFLPLSLSFFDSNMLQFSSPTDTLLLTSFFLFTSLYDP
uniref:Ig-like domain-containing protein n=1 Tax=Bubo bubo TaxID=30461 RepID=A0A8C0EJF6_BUBBB